MKRFLLLAVAALSACAFEARAAHWQVQGVRVGPVADESPAADTSAPAAKKDDKSRGASKDAARKNDPKTEKASGQPAKKEEKKADGGAAETPASISSTPLPAGSSGAPSSTSDAPAKSNPPAVVPVSNNVRPAAANKEAAPAAPAANGLASPSRGASALPPAPPLTAVYRVGVGDVLDIRILNQQDSRMSTLYTVLAGGVLEYPLLRDPVTVAGMTTDELAAQLVAELRHRGVYERPQVRVGVREYASHAVLVSGLVNDPGTKILRREAVPLYVVVAEAQPKPEAGRAVVVSHATGKTTSVDLSDPAAVNLLVQQGDVVNLVQRPPEFFYIGGEIISPGQKDFHAGMTLTQAVLASGGVTAAAGKVRVSRQGADGRLVSNEFDLREIQDGLLPDPVLQAGDRIEVGRVKPRK